MDGKVVKNVPTRDMARIVNRAERTPEGYLHAQAVATKAGILEYQASDGKMLRALRSRAEVMKPESLRSLANVPLTHFHPEVPGKLLDSGNAKLFAVGMTGDRVETDEDLVKTSIHIYDRLVADSIEAGNDEVSVGQRVTWTFIPGSDPEFGDYDCSLSDIIYNHLAVGLPVGDARAGREARVLLDSVTHTIDSEERTMPENMTKMKLDDMEYDVPQNLADAIKKHMKALDDEKIKGMGVLTKHLSSLKSYQPAASASDDDDDDDGDEEEMEGASVDSKIRKAVIEAKKRIRAQAREVSRLTGVTDSLNQKITASKDATTNKKFSEMVKARTQTLAKSVAILDSMGQDTDVAKLMEMEDADLKKFVVKALDPKNAAIDSKDAAYIEGRFDAAAEETNPAELGKILSAIVTGEALDGSEAGATAQAESWKPKPLTASKRVAA
jgi:hypothetical protein